MYYKRNWKVYKNMQEHFVEVFLQLEKGKKKITWTE